MKFRFFTHALLLLIFSTDCFSNSITSISQTKPLEPTPLNSNVVAYVERYIQLEKNSRICSNYKYEIYTGTVNRWNVANGITEEVEWFVSESFEQARSYRIWHFRTVNGEVVEGMELIEEFDAWNKGLEEICLRG